MTMLVGDNEVGVGPGIHVLAIGVGDYRHLLDGSEHLADQPLGLGQLSTSPLSAKAFVEWCLAPSMGASGAGLENAVCPLASVDCLISAAAPMPIQTAIGVQTPDRASMANIQAAFEGWLTRVDSHENNIGVFYFCGHGVQVADHYLLADDFGANKFMPWANAFNVSKTLRAVERLTRGSLFFLIDACREISRPMALSLGADPPSLAPIDLSKPVSRTSVALIEATGEGQLAFGTAGRPTRFTGALLTALSGYCGVRRNGAPTWNVDGEGLAIAIRLLLERENRTANRRQTSGQSIHGEATPLVRLGKVPSVMVHLDMLPEPQRSQAILFLIPAKGAKQSHPGAKGKWILDVSRGIYDVGAEPIGGEFPVKLYADQDIFPPVFDLTMEVP